MKCDASSSIRSILLTYVNLRVTLHAALWHGTACLYRGQPADFKLSTKQSILELRGKFQYCDMGCRHHIGT